MICVTLSQLGQGPSGIPFQATRVSDRTWSPDTVPFTPQADSRSGHLVGSDFEFSPIYCLNHNITTHTQTGLYLKNY